MGVDLNNVECDESDCGATPVQQQELACYVWMTDAAVWRLYGLSFHLCICLIIPRLSRQLESEQTFRKLKGGEILTFTQVKNELEVGHVWYF